MDSHRTTASAYVCQPTNHFDDLAQLQAVLKRYREIGGKVPAQIQTALEAAAAGQNVEASLNAACDGLMNFYLREENRCARQAGFASVAAMEAQRPTEWSRISELFDPCIAGVARQWQLTNIDYTINPLNPESALREFLRRTREQVLRITSRHVKKAVIDKARGKPPAYERPPR